jgi:hypothetical protein
MRVHQFFLFLIRKLWKSSTNEKRIEEQTAEEMEDYTGIIGSCGMGCPGINDHGSAHCQLYSVISYSRERVKA